MPRGAHLRCALGHSGHWSFVPARATERGGGGTVSARSRAGRRSPGSGAGTGRRPKVAALRSVHADDRGDGEGEKTFMAISPTTECRTSMDRSGASGAFSTAGSAAASCSPRPVSWVGRSEAASLALPFVAPDCRAVPPLARSLLLFQRPLRSAANRSLKSERWGDRTRDPVRRKPAHASKSARLDPGAALAARKAAFKALSGKGAHWPQWARASYPAAGRSGFAVAAGRGSPARSCPHTREGRVRVAAVPE